MLYSTIYTFNRDTILRRHRWEKNSNHMVTVKDIDEETRIFTHTAIDCKRCIKCDLKKGIVKTLSYFPKLVYFRNGDIISKETIPYECAEVALQMKQIQGLWKSTDFIQVEDFSLD